MTPPPFSRSLKRLSGLLAASVLLWAPGMAQTVRAPLPIGIAVAQTSDAALLGQEQVIGAQLAAAEFARSGGVGGLPLKLFFEDAGGDEAGALEAFRTALEQHAVLALVGPTLSQQAFAADHYANRLGVPVLGPSNTAPGIPQIGEFIARVSAPVSVLAPQSLRAALRQDPTLERVALFYAQNDTFATAESRSFASAVQKAGLKTVALERFSTQDRDFAGQVGRALRQQPHLAIISGLSADGGRLIGALRRAGYRGQIIGGNGMNTLGMLPVCALACEGTLITQAYNPRSSGAVNQRFRAAYRAKYRREPTQFAAQAYTAVQVIGETLRRIHARKPLTTYTLPELRLELNTRLLEGSFDTPLGQIRFTPEGEVIQRDFYVARIRMNPDGRTGRFEFLPRDAEATR